MPSTHKIFPDQAYVDNLNAQLPPGATFNAHDHLGQLIMNIKTIESLLNHVGSYIDPLDVTDLLALPEIVVDEQSDIDEARLVAIEDRLDLIEDRLTDLENP